MFISISISSQYLNSTLIIKSIKNLINTLSKNSINIHNVYYKDNVYVISNDNFQILYAHEIIIETNDDFNKIKNLILSLNLNSYNIISIISFNEYDNYEINPKIDLLIYENKDYEQEDKSNNIEEKFSKIRRIVVLNKEE